MNKWILLFFVFEVVVCEYDMPNSNDVKLLDSIYDEEPCLREGGRCVFEPDCPSDKRLQKRGLCPTQASRGVECCYGVSNKEYRCRKFGGSCYDECSPIITMWQAKDCPLGMKCCIFV